VVFDTYRGSFPLYFHTVIQGIEDTYGKTFFSNLYCIYSTCSNIQCSIPEGQIENDETERAVRFVCYDDPEVLLYNLSAVNNHQDSRDICYRSASQKHFEVTSCL
jgi:hypothetical protein